MKRTAKTTAATGIAACVACCAVPVLMTAGFISAGLAAALATWLPVLSRCPHRCGNAGLRPPREAAQGQFVHHRRRPRQRLRLPARSGASRLALMPGTPRAAPTITR